MPVNYRSLRLFLIGLVSLLILSQLHPTRAASKNPTYSQTNLVADVPGLAPTTDPLLVNSWGIARLLTGPWWVSDAETSVSTIYTGTGTPVDSSPGVQFVVKVESLNSDTASSTGIVSNAGSDFKSARFIFATEQGTIAAWIPGVDPSTAHIV